MNRTKCLTGMVSVIVPTFNNAANIEECVYSIISQTYKNVEIIIVDDGSTDGTSEVVASLINKYGNITYKKIQNSKSPTARNTGFALAQGEYVCAIDADDIWPEYKLEMQVSALKESPNSIVLGEVQSFTVNANGQKEWGTVVKLPAAQTKDQYLDSVMRMALEQMVMFNTFMAPTKIIQEDGLWNPAVITAHDWENWIRLAKKYQFVHINQVFQYYRKHSASTTAKHKKFQSLFFQLYVIDLHSKDHRWGWYTTLDYRRMKYDSWIRIYLYEREFLDVFKLIIKGMFDSNMMFSLKGLRLWIELFTTVLRSKLLGK